MFKDYIPREFSRKCRSLVELDRWKATEFRQFLLYSGIVALKEHLQTDQYNHFLLLFVGIFCLASPELSRTHADYAHKLLVLFVQQAGNFYGRGFLVYNVHGLTHIPADVKRFGPLDCYSAFPFENFLAQLKRLIRKPQFPLQQVVRRLSERIQLGLPMKRDGKKIVNDEPGKAHLRGPVPHNCNWERQFQQVYHNGLFYSVAGDGNKCVRIANSYFLIRNILTLNHSNEIMIVVQQFLSVSDFFEFGDSPESMFKSSNLDVVKVSNLSRHFETRNLTEIRRKYVCFPYKTKFVLVPLS